MKLNILNLSTLFAVGLLLSVAPSQAQSTLTWNPGGSNEGNGTWDTATANWTSGGADVDWTNGDTAVFNNTTTGTYIVTLPVSSGVSANGISFSGNTGSTEISGGIPPGAVLTSTGSTFNFTSSDFFTRDSIFNLIFKGTATTYNFSGGTGAAGKSSFGYIISGNATSFGSANVNVGSGSDSGVFEAQQNVLTTGTLTVNSGFEYINAVNPGSFAYTSQAITINGLGASGSGALNLNSGSQNFNGAITLGSDAEISGANPASIGTEIVSGSISGSHNLYLINNANSPVGGESLVIGAPTHTFGPTGVSKNVTLAASDNNYTGQTIIATGITPLTGNTGSKGTGPAATTANSAVRIGADNALPTGTTVVLGITGNADTNDGAGKIDSVNSVLATQAAANSNTFNAIGNTDGALDLNGWNQTVAGLVVGGTQVASHQIIENNDNTADATNFYNTAGTNTTATLTVDGATSVATGFGGTLQDNDGTDGTGLLAFAVTGGGSIALTGNSTYSGGTTVDGTGSNGTKGFLYADSASSTGTGTVTVNGTSATSYGTLGGGVNNLVGDVRSPGAKYQVYKSSAVVVTGPLTVNQFGHVSPGDTTTPIGTLEVADLTLNAGAEADFDFDGTTTANDYIKVDGLLTLGSSIVFNLNFIGVSDESGIYDMIGFSTETGFDPADFSTTGLGDGYAATFSEVANPGGDSPDVIVMTVSPSDVPEPSTWAMLVGGFGVLGLCLRLRRRSFDI